VNRAVTVYFNEFCSRGVRRGITLAATPYRTERKFDMAASTRSSKTTWIIIGVIIVVVALFAGFLPLPGQKDNETPHVQPSAPGTQPQAEVPTGPPASPPGDPNATVTQPPPGGTPAAPPGSGSNDVSNHTASGESPNRQATQ
jgi:hypothetical protein